MTETEAIEVEAAKTRTRKISFALGGVTGTIGTVLVTALVGAFINRTWALPEQVTMNSASIDALSDHVDDVEDKLEGRLAKVEQGLGELTDEVRSIGRSISKIEGMVRGIAMMDGEP